jgi:anthranilate synthase component 1
VHRGAPLISPVPVRGAALRALAQHDVRYPVFLDSAAQGPLGRYTMLAGPPVASLTRDAQGRLRADGVSLADGGFLDNLAQWAERDRVAPRPSPVLPFMGGWLVYLGYELAAEVEPRLRLPPANAPFSAFALRVDTLAIHDLQTDVVYAISERGDRRACEQLIGDLQAASLLEDRVSGAGPIRASIDEEDPALFLSRVRAAKEHIAAGDIYQANLSRPWRLELADEGDHGRVYAALRHANPAPFAARVHWQDYSILSSSPERLLRISGRDIATRPIAGTRARDVSSTVAREQDLRDTAELVRHPKERAEHIMLIDLERNDLGRVCEAGSVTVDEYMVTESYAHVHHIVSNVRGRLRADAAAVDALRALFPGGTITGCPKFRCMQIIAALEGEGRGAYTGSLGWLGTDGDADFSILIRTLTLQGNRVELRAGAGIVADSVPERELEETRVKARGLLRAFGAD